MATPGGLVDKQELIDAQLDTAHLGRVVNSKDASGNPIDTSTNRTGGVNKTLDALEAEYLEAIQGAGGIPVGTWAAGVTTFNAYNEYAVYNGIPYKPRTSATLPYVAQGADPTVAPDDANVQPYQEITEAQVVALVEETILDISDIAYKSSGGNSAIENMLTGVPVVANVGDRCSTGGTVWQKINDSVVGSTLANRISSAFVALTPICGNDFGAVGDYYVANLSTLARALGTANIPIVNPAPTDDTQKLNDWLSVISAPRGGVSYSSGMKGYLNKRGYYTTEPLEVRGDNLLIDFGNATFIKGTDSTPSTTYGNIAVPGGDVNPNQNAVLLGVAPIRFSKFENFNVEGIGGVSSPKAVWMTGNENEFSNIYGRFISDGLHIPSMWLTSVKKAIFRTSSGNGFWWDRERIGGSTGQSGTSIDMTDCASFGNRGKGFLMQDCDYLTMSSCACDNSLEEAYIFQGCTGLNAHIAFEDADPASTTAAIQLISGTNGTLTIDSFDSTATSKVGILASDAKVSIFGRLRTDYDTFISAASESIIDATGLAIQPITGSGLDPAKFSVIDEDSIIYATEQSGDANRWNVHQFTSAGVNITQKAAYLSSLTLPGGTPSFIYGNSKLRVVYDVTDFNTTYNNTIIVPLSEIEKVIPNFSQSTWAATPLELRITERGNIGVGEWVHIQGSTLANRGQRAYTTMGVAAKVAVSGVTINSDNLEITLDSGGGSRQRVSCEIVPL